MGIDYNARLVWGIRFKRPDWKKGEDEEAYEEKWDDVESKWNKKHRDETGVSLLDISFAYDGTGQYQGYFLVPDGFDFKTPDYSCVKIDIPVVNALVMIPKLRKACAILGIPYEHPEWYLMSQGT